MDNTNLLKYKTPQFFFLLFVISIGLQKSNYIIDIYTNFNIQENLGFSILLFPLLFLFLTIYYSKHSLSPIKIFKNDSLLFLIIILVHINLLVGFMLGNENQIIIQEYWTGLIAFFAYQISFDREVLEMFQHRLIYIIFYIFVCLTIVGTFHLQEQHLSIASYNPAIYFINTASVGYDMSPILDIWVFLFLIQFYNKKNIKKLYIYVPLIIYIAFQFYFLKRAPSARAVTYFIVAWIILMINRRTLYILLRSILLLTLIMLLLYFVIPKDLIDRFATIDVARQREASEMLSQLSTTELIFGRGLGGFFILEEGAALININDIGIKGKHILHIGILYPILKGGILLAMIIYLHVFNSIRRGLNSLKYLNKYQLSALTFLIVYSIFRLIEGPFSTGMIFDTFFFGLSLGLLNQFFDKNYKKSYEHR